MPERCIAMSYKNTGKKDMHYVLSPISRDNNTLPPWDTFMCTDFKLLVTTVTTLLASVTDGELWQGICIWRNGGRTCFLTLAKFSATIVKCRHLQLYCFDGN